MRRIEGGSSTAAWWRGLAAVAALAIAGSAWAQTSVSFGRITAVRNVTESNDRARAGGAIVGGAIGAAAGSNRSAGNRVMTGIGGAAAGNQVGRLATQRQAIEYTILLGGTQTITMVTDQAGKRVGDCVAVEQGSFNNLRLVADSKCAPPRAQPAAPAPQPAAATANDVKAANACIQAKEQLLAAETDDAFDRAERRVRLLCGE